MAYQKIQVQPGDVISSNWGNHIQTQYDEAKADLDAHLADNTNPHNVTKAQVGLGNVDNMSATSIRTDSSRALRVEVVSSSGSESPTAGRIVFDSSQGKFFGGNGSEWV